MYPAHTVATGWQCLYIHAILEKVSIYDHYNHKGTAINTLRCIHKDIMHVTRYMKAGQVCI